MKNKLLILFTLISSYVYSQDTLMVCKGEYNFDAKNVVIKQEPEKVVTFINLEHPDMDTLQAYVNKELYFQLPYNSDEIVDEDEYGRAYWSNCMTILIISKDFIEIQVFFIDKFKQKVFNLKNTRFIKIQ